MKTLIVGSLFCFLISTFAKPTVETNGPTLSVRQTSIKEIFSDPVSRAPTQWTLPENRLGEKWRGTNEVTYTVRFVQSDCCGMTFVISVPHFNTNGYPVVVECNPKGLEPLFDIMVKKTDIPSFERSLTLETVVLIRVRVSRFDRTLREFVSDIGFITVVQGLHFRGPDMFVFFAKSDDVIKSRITGQPP